MEHASDCAVHNEPALPAGPCDCRPIPQPHFRPRQVVVVSLLQLNYRGRVQSVSWDGFEWRVSVEYADDKGDLQTRQFYQDELVRVP